MTTHVYLKYAIALLMEEYGLQTEQEITFNLKFAANPFARTDLFVTRA